MVRIMLPYYYNVTILGPYTLLYWLWVSRPWNIGYLMNLNLKGELYLRYLGRRLVYSRTTPISRALVALRMLRTPTCSGAFGSITWKVECESRTGSQDMGDTDKYWIIEGPYYCLRVPLGNYHMVKGSYSWRDITSITNRRVRLFNLQRAT